MMNSHNLRMPAITCDYRPWKIGSTVILGNGQLASTYQPVRLSRIQLTRAGLGVSQHIVSYRVN
jgi:hypothetical protein